MEPDEGLDDEGPTSRWLPPDDRLWRHPSEVGIEARASARRPAARPMPWFVGILGGAIGSLLVVGMLGAGGAFNASGVRVVERVAMPNVAGTNVENVPAIAERVRPAIVRVEVRNAAGSARASGVVFRSDGHVLTSNHVADGASSVRVTVDDGRTLPAQVVGGDPDTDVAVLKVDAELPTAVMGTARDLRVGQLAIAVGSPVGATGSPSVAVGVVSVLAHQVQTEQTRLMDMIQTDAQVPPEASGGALCDASGAVVGLTTVIPAVGDEGDEVGLATPIDVARNVADQLISTGEVVHAWLGVEGTDVADGAVVRRVRRGSPAEAAGVRPGDVITHVDDARIASMAGLVVTLRSHRAGDAVKVAVRRDGRAWTTRALLAPRPRK